MEKDKKVNHEDCSCSGNSYGYGCHGGFGRFHRCGIFGMIFRVFFTLLILWLVFSFVFHFAGFNRSKYGMMGNGSYGSQMMGGYFGDDDYFDGKGSQLFGTITKVEGNQITILDNSAAEQVITSTAKTMIFSADTEIGLSALKAGQNIVIIQGKVPLEAKVIKVL